MMKSLLTAVLGDKEFIMVDFLYSISDLKLFILLICFFLLISVVSMVVIKRILPIQLRYKDNAVIANISSLIAIIYGVLASLMALYLINNVNYTDDAVQREANAIANIYRDSKVLPLPVHVKIKKQLQNYIQIVRQNEWPLMKKGKKINHEGDIVLENITKEIWVYNKASRVESLVLRDILEETKSLYNARQQRISQSTSSLTSEVWVVMLIGTFLLIAINYFFKARTSLHFIALAAGILTASSMIFLLLTLDKPFQGEFAVEPNAFQLLDEYMKSQVIS